MNTLFIILIGALFLLAIFDLWVGVSNDAVNFLNSAIGARVARMRTILLVAALGVFVGAIVSNGMMDIARHGIFQPQMFSFFDLLCIFMAVMVTDVVLLDVFNSLGMPTSTTVSMVFELLGGTFILSTLKIAADQSLSYAALLNTEKALSVILGIFVSVAIAFIAGAVVQWISRVLFTFNYKPRLKWLIGLFGGISVTAISYFVFIKGLGKSPMVSDTVKDFIDLHTGQLILGCFLGFTCLMELLYFLKVNVFKIIVLFGTFALAMAFASNDLVNFVGVPLAAFSSWQDFSSVVGANPHAYMMDSLNDPARTPFYFLFAAGVIMVISLCKSSKAQNVVKTSVELSRQAQGEEMFGSSQMARSLVRACTRMGSVVSYLIPAPVSRWINSRFQQPEEDKSDILNHTSGEAPAFDLVRASVNLVLAGLLIIMGTSLKLPLSTTYVTFIVAMGTSLADRAWTRESAVFRVTGVLNVIGGWFLTAGIAFVACGVICLLMYYGGAVAMVLLFALAVYLLWRNNLKDEKDVAKTQEEEAYRAMVDATTKEESWAALQRHHELNSGVMLTEVAGLYRQISDGFSQNSLSVLRKADKSLQQKRDWKKRMRQRELMGLRKIDQKLVLEKNTWFHLGSNAGGQMLYCLKRMLDPIREHVDNSFAPLSEQQAQELQQISMQVEDFITRAQHVISTFNFEPLTFNNKGGDGGEALLTDIDDYKEVLSTQRKQQLDQITATDADQSIAIDLLYLNYIQESQQLLSELRHFIRAYRYFER